MEKMGAYGALDNHAAGAAVAVAGDALVTRFSAQGGVCAGGVMGDCKS